MRALGWLIEHSLFVGAKLRAAGYDMQTGETSLGVAIFWASHTKQRQLSLSRLRETDNGDPQVLQKMVRHL